MAETELKEGDVVQLKSGGPKMTITSMEKSGECVCEWFLEGVDKEPMNRSFKSSALKKFEPGPQPW